MSTPIGAAATVKWSTLECCNANRSGTCHHSCGSWTVGPGEDLVGHRQQQHTFNDTHKYLSRPPAASKPDRSSCVDRIQLSDFDRHRFPHSPATPRTAQQQCSIAVAGSSTPQQHTHLKRGLVAATLGSISSVISAVSSGADWTMGGIGRSQMCSGRAPPCQQQCKTHKRQQCEERYQHGPRVLRARAGLQS
jgi:hypothetical protein